MTVAFRGSQLALIALKSPTWIRLRAYVASRQGANSAQFKFRTELLMDFTGEIEEVS
jgi:hypothetical protein